jgi:hypothetical protein
MKGFSVYPLRTQLHQDAQALPCEGTWGYGTKYGTNSRRVRSGNSDEVRSVTNTRVRSLLGVFRPFLLAGIRRDSYHVLSTADSARTLLLSPDLLKIFESLEIVYFF